ncbi:sigma-70 family RNA polymerase sigma factor [Catalinimonas sp. 4WD22]|uniref:RNA polymerase sigma factor n=1 Tax=Catalinimonas locisalis TaxID=3133978 RepID=UPI00310116DF
MPLQDRISPNNKWWSTDDELIWEAFNNGDKEALEYIYRHFINDLYHYGMKIKGHPYLVKDCIQELFVDLWKSRAQLSSTNNIKFYLLKALKFKINHRLKKEFTYHFHDLGEALTVEMVLPHESLLIQNQLQEEQQVKLKQAIKKLPDRQKEIIHLLFYEGLCYEKVSEIMAINVRSVYTLAWKALSSLRKTLTNFITLIVLWIGYLLS